MPERDSKLVESPWSPTAAPRLALVEGAIPEVMPQSGTPSRQRLGDILENRSLVALGSDEC